MKQELQQQILSAMAEARKNFAGSDAKYATSLGISASQYSQIVRGKTDRVLSDANWIGIARRLDVAIGNIPSWNTVKTPVFEFITMQLQLCQENASSLLLCDISDIGKTYTARHYVRSNKNAVYVDCSQVKTKRKLLRFIAQAFGVNADGRYSDVYADLVFYLRSLDCPLIILDEAGDLEYAAFLELKALWNATEGCCGWYMMGADGLRAKIHRSIEFKKVGYTELFSRYGSAYQKVSPDGAQELQEFKNINATLVAKGNACSDMDLRKVVVKSNGSLRRIYNEINKIRKVKNGNE